MSVLYDEPGTYDESTYYDFDVTLGTGQQRRVEPRNYTATFNTVRLRRVEPRNYTCTVTQPRMPMVTVDPIAPGESRKFTATFQLASGETVSTKTATAVSNCTAGAATESSGVVTSLITPTASTGYLEVLFRIVTSTGRELDRTMKAPIRHYKILWGDKDPDDIDDFTLNWAPLLGSLTISSATLTAIAGTVTVSASSNTTTLTTARVEDGADGEIAQVRAEIVTSDGQTVRTIMVVPVEGL